MAEVGGGKTRARVTKYPAAKLLAEYLYEGDGLGPVAVERVLRNKLPPNEVPSLDLIKKWTGPLHRGRDRPPLWDFIEAEPGDIGLIARYVRAEDLVRRASVSKVMVPEGMDHESVIPREGLWPNATVARWFIAFARLEPAASDTELAFNAQAASRDAEYGKNVALDYMLKSATQGDEDGR